MEAAENWIKAGNTTLIAFISIAVTISALGIAIGNPVLGFIAMLNVVLGALIGFPLVFIGNARLTKAKRLLSHPQTSHHPGIQGTSSQMPAIAQTNRLPEPLNQASVTEHTTLHLSNSEPAQRLNLDKQS